MAGESNETHWEQLGQPWRVTWAAGMSHVPPGVGSRDRRIRSGSDSAILDRGRRHLDLGWRHPSSGLNEPHWEHLGCPGRVTCMAGEGHVFPGSGHMTADPEVSRPAQSWITACSILARGHAILAQGLMSLIGSTFGQPGGSHGQRGGSRAPPGRGHVTAEQEVAWPVAFGSQRAPSCLRVAPSGLRA